jgi:thiol:disulfide interchange protein DsbC
VKTNWLLPILVLTLPAAVAQEAAGPSRADVAAKLRERGVNIEAGDLRDSAIEGFYEIRIGAKVGYISQDGQYLFEGELYDLDVGRNLTESSRSAARVDLLGGVDSEQMIVFAPKDRPAEHTITIFTDVDCGYCRQFHREIDQVNALGIEVHYLFYPRTGPNTESWSKAERVWCADDKNSALTNAKLGGPIPDAICANNPVGDQYDLGQQVGVTGTPSVYTASGVHIGGYLPPDQLLETLIQLGD